MAALRAAALPCFCALKSCSGSHFLPARDDVADVYPTVILSRRVATCLAEPRVFPRAWKNAMLNPMVFPRAWKYAMLSLWFFHARGKCYVEPLCFPRAWKSAM